MEQPPKPKLSAQERLDALYELKMAVWTGQVALNPQLTKDPDLIKIKGG
jgi:hypothetical protein